MSEYLRVWIELEREEDGRWIADMSDEYPGVMCYGSSRTDALRKVFKLAMEALDREEGLL